MEGDAREFVNKVQTIRKDSGFALTDRIIVEVLENAELQSSLIRYKTYICAEILADSLAFMTVLNDGIEIDVNNAILKVNVLKKG
jgi:isoleucyl-tRNA synthetase